MHKVKTPLYSLYLGWEWDFYFFAISGIVFCIFWLLFIYSSPSIHPKISSEERQIIESGIGSFKSNVKIPGPPYKKIICSVPFWSLVLTYISTYWGFYTLLTNVPTYLYNIQHIPLTLVRSIFINNNIYFQNALIFVEIFASILTNCMVTLSDVSFWQKVGFNLDIVEEMYFGRNVFSI